MVLRGNSGSGKSTVARELQARLGHPTAILQQDHFRRIVYREREGQGAAHIDLLEAAARHCFARGDHVILDGIFNASRYEPLLSRVANASDDSRFYAFDLTFDETAARHATRTQALEFTVDEMREWYHGWQPLSFVAERRVGPDESVDQIVNRILTNQ